ncbi:MAG: hypothetical protein K6G62_03530 [Eubacterium sp.]|nr:hypothetical protein [Eubacterium sp.]
MKSYLYNQGALAISCLADRASNSEEGKTSNFSYENGALYNVDEDWKDVDHEVLIVGWDDDYPKENFKTSDNRELPPGDGAWLAKNSWGVNCWGNTLYNEYMYYKLISWKDTSVYEVLGGKTIQEAIDSGQEIFFRKTASDREDKTWELCLEEKTGSKVIAKVTRYSVTVEGDRYIFMGDEETELGVGQPTVQYSHCPTWDGYFYISYYDRTICSVAGYEGVKAEDDYDNLYTYCYNGCNDGGNEIEDYEFDSALKVSNVFTAQKDETIKAINIAMGECGTVLSLDVYTFPVGTRVKNPESGIRVEKAHLEKQMTYAGQYTLELPTPVEVEKGQSYALVAKLKRTDLDGGVKYFAPIERTGYTDSSPFDYQLDENTTLSCVTWSVIKANEEESYIYNPADKTWYDVTDVQGLKKAGGDVWNATYLGTVGRRVCGVGNVILSSYTDDGISPRTKVNTTEVESSENADSKVSLSGDKVDLKVASATYTGKALKPQVTAKYNGTTLKEGTDFSLTYSKNKKAGKKAQITLTGKGNYTGSVTVNFTIKKRKLTKKNAAVKVAKAVYTGRALKPKVTVKWKGSKLKKSRDYTLKYSKNKKVGKKALVKITGKGNFKGSIKKNFTIKKK